MKAIIEVITEADITYKDEDKDIYDEVSSIIVKFLGIPINKRSYNKNFKTQLKNSSKHLKGFIKED
jgi:hypothetical protein